MRLKIRDVKKIAWVCAAILFMIAVHMVTAYLFAVHRFSVSYDDALTAKASQEIEQFVEDVALHKHTAKDAVAALKCAFPFIKEVSCCYLPDRVHMKIKVYTLLARLDGGSILTQNNVCLADDYYVSSLQNDLPTLHAADGKQGTVSPELFDYLSSLDPVLMQSAHIYCRNDHELLCDLPGRPMRLICNYYSKPTARIVDYCMRIAEDMAAEKTTRPCFTADIRFADRIIVGGLRSGGVIA